MKKSGGKWPLIEGIFITSIVFIVLGNFLYLNANSEKNNTIPNNHVRATQIVQKSIQSILAIQSNKTEKLIQINNQLYSWEELFNQTFLACDNPQDPKTTCSDFIITTCPSEIATLTKKCLMYNDSFLIKSPWQLEKDITQYSQKIRIYDYEKNIKKITVIVWWNDSLGLHKSVISREFKK